MAQKLVLSDKIYNINFKKKKSSILSRYYKYLNEKILGFPDTKIIIKKLRDYDKRIEITINGPEEVFVTNILKKEIGFVHQFDQIKEKNTYKGTIVDLGKVGFGIFVDCAILNPEIDVLITLHTLREQLCNGKEKSLREIIKTYDLIENFPLFIHITSIDLKKKQIEGRIGDRTIGFFKFLLNEKLDAVLITGETKAQFKKALIKTNHYRDIAKIERFGFLENIVLLKRGTNAPGIINDIGKYLKGCKLSAIKPDKISKLFE
ncbi:MAG: DUF2110 family protein [Candidatus Thorarchaeota archaeon]